MYDSELNRSSFGTNRQKSEKSTANPSVEESTKSRTISPIIYDQPIRVDFTNLTGIQLLFPKYNVSESQTASSPVSGA